jgi:toxin ParE1/3/4
MPIVWLPVAVQDVIHLRTYIADQDPESARGVALRIDKAVGNLNLGQMPNLGRPGRIFGTRELIVSGTSYLVVYQLQNGRVEILRVLHGRQPFPESL